MSGSRSVGLNLYSLTVVTLDVSDGFGGVPQFARIDFLLAGLLLLFSLGAKMSAR